MKQDPLEDMEDEDAWGWEEGDTGVTTLGASTTTGVTNNSTTTGVATLGASTTTGVTNNSTTTGVATLGASTTTGVTNNSTTTGVANNHPTAWLQEREQFLASNQQPAQQQGQQQGAVTKKRARGNYYAKAAAAAPPQANPLVAAPSNAPLFDHFEVRRSEFFNYTNGTKLCTKSRHYVLADNVAKLAQLKVSDVKQGVLDSWHAWPADSAHLYANRLMGVGLSRNGIFYNQDVDGVHSWDVAAETRFYSTKYKSKIDFMSNPPVVDFGPDFVDVAPHNQCIIFLCPKAQ